MGSVRRAGQRARISAQLVRATDGQGVWAERFDRTLEDLFDVQAEVSKRIVEALEVTLRPGEREMLDRAPTRNAEAYRLYLRGREMIDQGREDNFKAEEVLKQAIELDPEFALAHAALGECLAVRKQYWWGGLEDLDVAKAHVQRALELDPDQYEAHFARAILHRISGEPERLLEALDHVLALDPDNGQALEWAAWCYMSLGRTGEGVAILEPLTETHPDRYMAVSFLSSCYEILGRKDDVRRMEFLLRERSMDVLRKQPMNVHARVILGGSLIRLGETEQGMAQVERAIELAPLDGRIRYNAACAFARAGQPDRAIEQLTQAVAQAPSYIADWPRRDPDLASVRDRPEFIAIFGS